MQHTPQHSPPAPSRCSAQAEPDAPRATAHRGTRHAFAHSAALAVGLTVASCGGGGGSSATTQSNFPPRLEILEPSLPKLLPRGGLADIVFTAQDFEDQARVALVADGDGDFTTTGDQHLVVSATSDPAGTRQQVLFDTSPLGEGQFAVLGAATDPVHPTQMAMAPASLITENIARVHIIGSPETESRPVVATTPDGATFVAGRFSDTLTLDPTPGATPLTSLGRTDVFLLARDANDNFRWAIQAGGTSRDHARVVTALADGGCLLVGSHYGELTLGAATLSPPASSSSTDLHGFVARFAQDGTLLWLRGLFGGVARAFDACPLPDGACAVTGAFSDVLQVGTGGAGDTARSSAGEDDGFLAIFEADGSLRTLGTLASTDFDALAPVTPTPDGFWVLGATQGDAGQTTPGPALLLTKLTPSGVTQRAIEIAVDGELENASVTVDGDSVTIIGGFSGTLTFAPGTPNTRELEAGPVTAMYVARFDAAGALEWTRLIQDSTETFMHTAVALRDGSILVTGEHLGTIAFSPEISLTAQAGAWNLFLLRMDRRGNAVWARPLTGAQIVDTTSIGAFPDGSFVIANSFHDVTVGAGDARETTLSTGGDFDIFVARFNGDGRF